MAERKPTKKRSTRSKTKAASKPSKSAPAAKKAPSKPKHTYAQLARRKASLIAGLKDPKTSPEKAITLSEELAEERYQDVPILNPRELARL